MPLTLFRPSQCFTQSCPASCDQPQFEFVCACMCLGGCMDVFVKVLARVRGEPSVGHGLPAAPSHSDTVTKEDPPDSPLYPSARSDTKTWPGCFQPCSPTEKHMFCRDDPNHQSQVRCFIIYQRWRKNLSHLNLIFLGSIAYCNVIVWIPNTHCQQILWELKELLKKIQSQSSTILTLLWLFVWCSEGEY